MDTTKLETFQLKNEILRIKFQTTQLVKDGVSCDVYAIFDDPGRDLAVITVRKNCATPRQRVKRGVSTVEGYITGIGSLHVQAQDGKESVYKYGPGLDIAREVEVKLGEVMQWRADAQADLVFYEVCEPPYVEGRFEALPD